MTKLRIHAQTLGMEDVKARLEQLRLMLESAERDQVDLPAIEEVLAEYSDLIKQKQELEYYAQGMTTNQVFRGKQKTSKFYRHQWPDTTKYEGIMYYKGPQSPSRTSSGG
jgi:hypothetical protein